VPTVEGISSAAKTVIDRCRKLSRFSEQSGCTTRTFLSPPMHDCHRAIREWITPLGAETRIDAAGNLRAFYAAREPNAPRLLIGSHLDTVPNAGAFDGVLGVVLGIALLEVLDNRRLPFAMEIVGFSEEEGVRFGAPFLGSLALVGKLDEALLERKDDHGISVRQAIEHFGLRPNHLEDARLKGDTLGFLEFHIEQGPALEELGLPLGVVEAIAGQSRLELTFVGEANHAGTTPMRLRRDALAGAGEWIHAVEREAGNASDLVATVGAIHVKPGATNVIAGEARLSLDVRHRSDQARCSAVENMLQLAGDIAARRRLSLRKQRLLDQPSVAMNSLLVTEIETAVRQAGCQPHRLVSGAGHDAMILAAHVPSAMIFLRSPGGTSHSPEERVQLEDVEKALEAGLYLLEGLASSSSLRRNVNAHA
jgi:allantoate deiminase